MRGTAHSFIAGSTSTTGTSTAAPHHGCSADGGSPARRGACGGGTATPRVGDGCSRQLRTLVCALSLSLSLLGLLALLSGVGAAPAGAEEGEAFGLPTGVLPPEVPADNPQSPAKVDLGRELFFDTRLSSDGTVACATCHDPRHGFADGRGTEGSAGVGGQLGPRNAPTVLNAAFLLEQFWDGRAATLEAQAVLPFVNPIEMGIADHETLERLVAELPDYPPRFAASFGDAEVRVERIGQALAAFERTLLSVSSPLDRFLAGDAAALSPAAQRGWELYNGKARCNTCHGYVESFPLFTDEEYRNIGVAANAVNFDELARRAQNAPEDLEVLASDPGFSELGRFTVTREPRHIGAFKSPQLRNVALTPPYMHDGSEATLLDVIEFYDRGGNPNPFLDGGMRPLQLNEREKLDLVALLEAMNSDDLDRFADLAERMR